MNLCLFSRVLPGMVALRRPIPDLQLREPQSEMRIAKTVMQGIANGHTTDVRVLDNRRCARRTQGQLAVHTERAARNRTTLNHVD